MDDAACEGEVEAAIRIRQRHCICLREGHVSEAAGFGKLLRLGQHLVRDVARDHLRNMRGECERRVPSAGGDIECAPVLLRPHQIDQTLETGTFRVNR